MTAEKSIKILKAVKELKDDVLYTLTDLTEAYKMAIEALSKQSASSEQVDKSVIVDFVAFQREWLNSHKTLELDAVNNALVNIFLKTTGKAFIDSLGQSAENDEDRTRDDEGPKLFGKRTIIEPGEEFIGEDLLKKALDQSADSAKMIKLKKRTITERLIIAESLINSVIVDSDQFREDAKKTDDVPDMNVGKIPYKKPEIICDPDCEGFVCHKNGIYGWCPKTERWGCEYFYELERRNDE